VFAKVVKRIELGCQLCLVNKKKMKKIA